MPENLAEIRKAVADLVTYCAKFRPDEPWNVVARGMAGSIQSILEIVQAQGTSLNAMDAVSQRHVALSKSVTTLWDKLEAFSEKEFGLLDERVELLEEAFLDDAKGWLAYRAKRRLERAKLAYEDASKVLLDAEDAAKKAGLFDAEAGTNGVPAKEQAAKRKPGRPKKVDAR